MTYTTADIAALVEPKRLHRNLYVDPEIFDLEMQHIWGGAWIYIGHASHH